MTATYPTPHHEIDARLRVLTADLQVSNDEPVRRRDGELEVFVHPDEMLDGSPGLLIGVECGGRLRPAMHGFAWQVFDPKDGRPVSGGAQHRYHTARIPSPTAGVYSLRLSHPADCTRRAFDALRGQYELAAAAPDLREWAVRQSAGTHLPEAVQFLYGVLDADPDAGVRAAAASTLAALRPVWAGPSPVVRDFEMSLTLQGGPDEGVNWSKPSRLAKNEADTFDATFWFKEYPTGGQLNLWVELTRPLTAELLAVRESGADATPTFFIPLTPGETTDPKGPMVLCGEIDLTYLRHVGVLARLPDLRQPLQWANLTPVSGQTLTSANMPALAHTLAATPPTASAAIRKLKRIIRNLTPPAPEANP